MKGGAAGVVPRPLLPRGSSSPTAKSLLKKRRKRNRPLFVWLVKCNTAGDPSIWRQLPSSLGGTDVPNRMTASEIVCFSVFLSKCPTAPKIGRRSVHHEPSRDQAALIERFSNPRETLLALCLLEKKNHSVVCLWTNSLGITRSFGRHVNLIRLFELDITFETMAPNLFTVHLTIWPLVKRFQRSPIATK